MILDFNVLDVDSVGVMDLDLDLDFGIFGEIDFDFDPDDDFVFIRCFNILALSLRIRSILFVCDSLVFGMCNIRLLEFPFIIFLRIK